MVNIDRLDSFIKSVASFTLWASCFYNFTCLNPAKIFSDHSASKKKTENQSQAPYKVQ